MVRHLLLVTKSCNEWADESIYHYEYEDADAVLGGYHLRCSNIETNSQYSHCSVNERSQI